MNKNFKKIYYNLSRENKQHIHIRNKIVLECKISTPIFYNWVKGITPVPDLAKPIISKILNISEDVIFP